MSHNGEGPNHSARGRWLKGPVITVLVMTALNVLFWFRADFGTFHPPSEGTLGERFLLTVITEIGPFAWFLLRDKDIGENLFAGFLGVALLLLVVLTLRVKRRRVFWSILASVGVLVWLFFGFAVAGLRIT
jgi:hypothetical protein